MSATWLRRLRRWHCEGTQGTGDRGGGSALTLSFSPKSCGVLTEAKGTAVFDVSAAVASSVGCSGSGVRCSCSGGAVAVCESAASMTWDCDRAIPAGAVAGTGSELVGATTVVAGAAGASVVTAVAKVTKSVGGAAAAVPDEYDNSGPVSTACSVVPSLLLNS